MLPTESNAVGWSAQIGDLVHRNTRADLLASDELVDVSALALGAGFRVPVAVSRVVWLECIGCLDASTGSSCTYAEIARPIKLLSAAARAALKQRHRRELLFGFAHKDPERTAIKTTTLKLICGPGDQCEPVVTVLERYED